MDDDPRPVDKRHQGVAKDPKHDKRRTRNRSEESVSGNESEEDTNLSNHNKVLRNIDLVFKYDHKRRQIYHQALLNLDYESDDSGLDGSENSEGKEDNDPRPKNRRVQGVARDSSHDKRKENKSITNKKKMHDDEDPRPVERRHQGVAKNPKHDKRHGDPENGGKTSGQKAADARAEKGEVTIRYE